MVTAEVEGGGALGLEGSGRAGAEGGILRWERSPVATGVSRLEDLQSCPVDHWGVFRGRS